MSLTPSALPDLRIGLGLDRHRLVAGGPLRLGGVSIPSPVRTAGHSDADALLHAAADAILGAAGDDDLGTLFPDTDPAGRGADSSRLAATAHDRARARGFQVCSLDAVILTEVPRIAPHRRAIRERLAELFDLPVERVNVKAKTGEGAGPVGRGEVLEATVVALLFHGGGPR